MRRRDGIAYLTQCADRNGDHYWNGHKYPADDCRTCDGTNDAGHLRTFSHYGRTSAECAPVAWRLAYLIARETGTEITLDDLDHAMRAVVNEHDDVAYVIRNYGYRKYA